MVAKNVDYESRRRSVLTITINKYIQEAVPVASDDIAKDFELSSATIRNIFAELEEEGYLTHPYTSGGRMPTVRGYRYYVDLLISKMQLLDEEKINIRKEFNRVMRRLEDALERTSEIISSITHYASIVSFLDRQDRFFYNGISNILEQPEFQDIDKMRLLLRALEQKQNILTIINREFQEKVKVYIGEELDCPGVDTCSLIVTTYSRRNKPSGKIAVLGPMRMEYKQIIPALEFVSEELTSLLNNI